MGTRRGWPGQGSRSQASSSESFPEAFTYPFFRRIVAVVVVGEEGGGGEEVRVGVVVGILWNGRRSRKRRDTEPRRDRQTGNQKKKKRSATIGRKNGVRCFIGENQPKSSLNLSFRLLEGWREQIQIQRTYYKYRGK